MSEHIVHTGILEELEDSFAIAQYLPQVPADFAEVILDEELLKEPVCAFGKILKSILVSFQPKVLQA
jgi:hypothetical protein